MIVLHVCDALRHTTMQNGITFGYLLYIEIILGGKVGGLGLGMG